MLSLAGVISHCRNACPPPLERNPIRSAPVPDHEGGPGRMSFGLDVFSRGSAAAELVDGTVLAINRPTDHPPLLLNGKKPPYLRFVCHLCYGPEKMLSQQTLPICNVSRNCSIITSSWRLPGAARCSLPGGVSPQGHHGKLDKDHRRGCSSGSRQNAGAAPGSTRFPPTFSRPDASYQEPRHEVKT